MSAQVLHNRVSRFLADHLPFSYLKAEDLLKISNKAEIKFFDKGELIFAEGEPHSDHFYVIQQGSVELTFKEGNEEILSDIVDGGDIFGIKAILGKRNYINTARSSEESLVIAIPYSTWEPFLESDPRISLYFAAGFSSGRSQLNMHNVEKARKNLTRLHPSTDSNRSLDGVRVFQDREVIYCTRDTSIRDAARLMTEKRVGSVLVLDIEDRPIGIVSDVDFRKKVVSYGMDINSSVDEIMTSPVFCVKKDISLAQSLILMMQKNIRHLCVTRDGTDKSTVEGIITEHDIFLIQGSSPAVISKEMLNAKDISQLKSLREKADELIQKYLEEEVSMSFIFEIITEINDTLIMRMIHLVRLEMTTEGYSAPDVKFSWLSLGSEGRKEQALKTDQDNAIIYEDCDDPKKEVNRYFLELGKRVNDYLYQCGFSYCKGEIMARNPKWCASLSQWKEYFADWIESPTPDAIMHFSIFFDLRSVYGDGDLVGELVDFIHAGIQKNPNSLRFLAMNSISNSPPLGIFRGFSLEKQGLHKDHFDIKARGTVPIVDAARVLSLEASLRSEGTLERFRDLGNKFPEKKNEFMELAITFEILARIRLKNSFNNPMAGNFINPKTLNKIDVETLKHSFQIIRELQKKLEVHFRLDLIPS